MRKVVQASLGAMLVVALSAGMSGIASAAVIRAKSTNTWSPAVLRVDKGTRVRWTNPDVATHNVSATSSNWTKITGLSSGASTSYRFRKAGRYTYTCTLHGGMDGKIIVR